MDRTKLLGDVMATAFFLPIWFGVPWAMQHAGWPLVCSAAWCLLLPTLIYLFLKSDGPTS